MALLVSGWVLFVFLSNIVILIIHGFRICDLPTQQNSFVTLKSVLMVLLWTFAAIHRVAKNSSCPLHHVLAEVEQGNTAFFQALIL